MFNKILSDGIHSTLTSLTLGPFHPNQNIDNSWLLSNILTLYIVIKEKIYHRPDKGKWVVV